MECINDCNQALELDPTYVKGHVRLARAHCELGQFDIAAASLRKAIDLQVCPSYLVCACGNSLDCVVIVRHGCSILSRPGKCNVLVDVFKARRADPSFAFSVLRINHEQLLN